MERSRPDKDSYYIGIAHAVAKRSTCLRLQVGAVCVRDDQILSTGYNGAPRGLPHCTSETCGTHIEHCKATVHAELNALLSAAYHGVSTKGATLYCTHLPCEDCIRAIINAGIVRVVFDTHYGSGKELALLSKGGIRWQVCTIH